MRLTVGLSFLVLVSAGPADAGPHGLFVYPEQGQAKERQAQDEVECQQWAKTETRFDPNVAPNVNAGAAPRGGEVVRGGLRGALAGAAIGAIAGDAGKGAAIGAGVGGAAGLGRRRAARDYENQASANAQAGYDRGLDNYKRALGACLEARGYTVK